MISQSSVVPVVAGPKAYSQPSTTYTIIPTEAVVSGGAIGGHTKPGYLPIKDTVVQPAPIHQGTPAIHYIFEPLVQTASTPVVYSKSPVGVTYTQTSTGNHQVLYHTEAVGSRSMPVTTTKPYAIVPAQRTGSIELQGVAVNQGATPVISPHVQLGYGSLSTTPYIQTAVTPSSDSKQVAQSSTESSWSSTGCVKSAKITRIPQAAKSPLGNNMQREPNEQPSAQLEEIGKNISDAFANSSEQMLIAAFEDAWKKFQANGRRYQSAVCSSSSSSARKTTGQLEMMSHPKSVAPPNAEVVSVPGTSSRLSLIRPTYSRSKISAVQSVHDQLVCVPADTQSRLAVGANQTGLAVVPNQPGLAVAAPIGDKSVQFLYCSDGSLQPQIYSGTSEYPGLYTISPRTAHPTYDQVVNHTHRPAKVSHKTSQIQTSGIFIPAHAGEIGVSVKQPAAMVLEQAKSVVQTQRSQQQQVILGGERVKQTDQVAVQHLSVLRKSQPIILDENGHQVVKPKSATTANTAAPLAGKAAHWCALCAKEATYLCSGCRGIWYCGKECQV